MITHLIFTWEDFFLQQEKLNYPYCSDLEHLAKKWIIGMVSTQYRGPESFQADLRGRGILELVHTLMPCLTGDYKDYAQCILNMHTTPSHTLIIDNRMYRGITAGRIIGCTTCLVETNDRYLDEQDHPTYRVHHLSEIELLIG